MAELFDNWQIDLVTAPQRRSKPSTGSKASAACPTSSCRTIACPTTRWHRSHQPSAAEIRLRHSGHSGYGRHRARHHPAHQPSRLSAAAPNRCAPPSLRALLTHLIQQARAAPWINPRNRSPLTHSPLTTHHHALHILGICGTSWAASPPSHETRPHRTGCDANVYPPMSDQLRALASS